MRTACPPTVAAPPQALPLDRSPALRIFAARGAAQLDSALGDYVEQQVEHLKLARVLEFGRVRREGCVGCVSACAAKPGVVGTGGPRAPPCEARAAEEPRRPEVVWHTVRGGFTPKRRTCVLMAAVCAVPSAAPTPLLRSVAPPCHPQRLDELVESAGPADVPLQPQFQPAEVRQLLAAAGSGLDKRLVQVGAWGRAAGSRRASCLPLGVPWAVGAAASQWVPRLAWQEPVDSAGGCRRHPAG